MMALIKAQHAAGKRYEWNESEPGCPYQRQDRLGQ
jgi:hypothetical protein